jgi:hypothetical protein
MIRNTLTTMTLAICLLAPALAQAQDGNGGKGRNRTENVTDTTRGVNIENTYDSRGNLIRTRESDLQGQPLSETEREFDKNNKLTKETEKDGRGRVTKETTIEYDAKTGAEKRRIIRRYYPNGKLRSETIITVDKDGNTKGETRSWDEDGKPSGSGSAKDRVQGRISHDAGAESGLKTVTFSSPRGAMHVYLPADMAAGDTISGTVQAEPAGRTENERLLNAGELNGYVLEVENSGEQNGTTLENAFSFGIPAAGGAVAVVLRDKGGDEIGRAMVPVAPQADPVPPTFDIPQLAQAGRPLTVSGPFDGQAAGTAARIGDHQAAILAESPRSMVMQVPIEIVGLSLVSINEGPRAVEAELNSIRVNLSAPATHLLENQKTTVTATVEGLAGMKEEAYPLLLDVKNLTPTVIAMGKGGSPVLVQPVEMRDVDENGRYTLEVPLQGIRSGSFSMKANVRWQEPSPETFR